MQKQKITPQDAADIRAINKAIPGLKWGTCRACGSMCPLNFWSGGNIHATCEDPPPVPVKRVKKEADPNQGSMFG